MAEQITVIQEIIALIKQTKGELDGVNASIVEISKNARKSKSAFEFSSPKGVNEEIRKTAVYTEQLNAQIKEQDRLEKALISQIAKKNVALESTNIELQKQRFETAQLNKQAKEQAILSSKLSTYYQKQNVILNQLTRRRQELVLKQQLGVKLTKDEIRESKNLEIQQRKLQSAFKKTDETVGRFQRNVGNYKSGLQGIRDVFKGLIGAFGIIEGLRLGFDFTKEAIATAKAAKGVEFAFNRLGDSGVSAFDRVKRATRGLISDLDIKTALVDFDNFNISLEESDTLFEFLAVRAAQTGKSIDSLRDSLVEGLSKESKLRIDNLGISAAELNEELEKTPDFVKAVANIAKREVAEAGDILDKASNSSERWGVALQNAKLRFGQLLTSGNTNLLGMLANRVEAIGESFTLLDNGLKILKNGINDIFTPIKNFIAQFPFLEKTITSINSKFGDFFKIIFQPGLKIVGIAFAQIGATFSGVGAAASQLKKEIISLFNLLISASSILINPIKAIRKLGVEGFKALANDIKKQFNDLGSNVADAYSKAYSNALKSTQKEEQSNITSKIKLTQTIDGQNKAIEGTLKYLKEQISELENLRDTTAVTNSEYQDFNDKIKVFEDSIEQLTTQFENLQAAQEKARKEAEKYEVPTPVSPGFEFQNIEERGRSDDPVVSLWETRLEAANEYFQKVSGIANGFYANNIQNIENELKRNQDYYDDLIAQAEGNERVQEILREEKEKKERQLEAKRKEQQKRQAIITKAANAAEIIQNTAVAVSKALAQTGFFGGPAAAAFIGALGAAQLAVVLSAPIPEFAEGYLQGNYEGYAKINDASGSNYKEIVERKDGTLEMFNKRNQIISMQKGDKVHKAGTFNGEDIVRNATLMNMITQGEALNDAMIVTDLTANFKDAIKGLKLPTPNVNVSSSSIDYKKLAKAVSLERLANKV